jgi:inactive STAND/Domain of unknown function (DUF4145)
MRELEARVLRLAKELKTCADELRWAYVYISEDPASSLTKSRVVLEKLLVELYADEMGKEPRRPLINELLQDNQFTRKIERRILVHMNAVRDIGNLGPHDCAVEGDEAESALDHLCVVLDWYLRRRSPDRHRSQDRRTIREVPALLHFHCDRFDQEHQIEETLRQHTHAGPLVFIVHGDEYQCHDKFLERLSLISLPRILGLDQNCIGVKEYLINFPSSLSDPRRFRDQLLKNLSLRVLNRSSATADEIAGLFVRLSVPVILQVRVLTDEWVQGGRAIITSFLDFWAEWPVQAARFQPLVFLNVTYQRRSGAGLLGWHRRIARQRANARLRRFLDSLATVSCRRGVVILDELLGVTQNDLEVWAQDMYTQQFCGDRDLLGEVRDLCRQPGLRDPEGRIAMEIIAAELKRILGARRLDWEAC